MRTAIGLLFCVTVLPGLAHGAENTPLQWLQLGSGKSAYTFPVYANQNLQALSPDVQRVIIVQHGAKRNADVYFQTMQALLPPDPKTLLIAPAFLTATDPLARQSPGPFWTAGSWIHGLTRATDGKGPGTFQVYADLIQALRQRHPAPFQQILFAGHSGGGQFVQRFAMLNRIDESLRAEHTDVRYLVANPSTYLYSDARRPVLSGDWQWQFSVPALAAKTCPDWNDYKYGFGKMPHGETVSEREISLRYMQRQVSYLLGENDTDPEHPLLDKHCAAELQGAHRFARGQGYWAFLQLQAKESGISHVLLQNQHLHVIPATGHDQRRIFSAKCVAAIFKNQPPVSDCSVPGAMPVQAGD